MSIIKVFSRINESVVDSFIKAEKELKEEKVFHIFINSYGGNYGDFGRVSSVIFNIAQKRVLISGEAIRAESASMLLFLNCSERIVSKKSIGVIHLPEPKMFVSEEIYEKTRLEALNFIKRRTHLSKDTVISLNKIELTSEEMCKLHIATKKVDYFKWAEPY
ncbi:MAG: hypothetical protein QG674_245 [Patescibacteria group bacterium]|jgi:hypothetical protein|nr:hypothetical protein [Patescibacteria group bacterium]